MSDLPNIVRLTLEDLGEDASPLENFIEQQQKRIAELEAGEDADLALIANRQEKINELAATVERFRGAILDYHNKNHDLNILLVAATATPHQNLNHVKREVARMAYKQGFNDAWNEDFFDGFDEHTELAEYHANDYANTKHPSDKETE